MIDVNFTNKQFLDTNGNTHRTEDVTGVQFVQNFDAATKYVDLSPSTFEVDDFEIDLYNQTESYFNVQLKTGEWTAVDGDSLFAFELFDKYVES